MNVNVHTAVKLVRSRILFGLLVGGVAVGVGDFALLAELACAGHVQDVDEEGGCGGGQDEAVCVGEGQSNGHFEQLYTQQQL